MFSPGRLRDPLRHRLRGAHHRAGADGLVGRDEDEALAARGDCRLCRHPSRDRVVADRLQGIGLHQWDVLVGGRVEDDLRLEPLHHLEHPLGLLAVGEHRLDPGEVPLLDHLPVDPEEVVLGVVEDDQELRAHPGDLANQLRADRAAGAGHQDDLLLHVGADPVELHLHRLAAEDVLDLHLAQLPGELHAAAEQLEDRRQRPHGDVALPAGRDHTATQHSRCRRDRDDHHVGVELVQQLADLLRGAEDVEAVQPHAALARVVVEEADRLGAEVGVQLQLSGDHLAP